MQIRFDPDSRSFKVMDLGIGLGAYSRIENGPVKDLKPTEGHLIKSTQLINVGQSLLLVSTMDFLSEEHTPALLDSNKLKKLRENPHLTYPLLKIKVVNGPCYGRMFVCDPLDQTKSHHILGRVDDCDIHLSD